MADTTESSIAEVEKEDEKKALQLRRRRQWSDLPPDLLELIATKGLTTYDKIRASRVCKTWHSVLRVVNRFPWIFSYSRWDTDRDAFELIDPTKPKSYSIDIPEELRGATARYAKDGWLLFDRHSTCSLFFFNPFTRELIKLPDYSEPWSMCFAFSCAPTSPGCLVFIGSCLIGGDIGIHTCHPGATEWTTSIHGGLHFVPNGAQKMVVCNGLFYCLCFLEGLVGIFDPQGRKWTVHNATPATWPARRLVKFACPWNSTRTFVAEYRGAIVGVHAGMGENPILLKLHDRRGKVEWNEMRSLDGAAFFAGFVASHARNRIDLPPGILKNRIYFSVASFVGKRRRCVLYSIDDGTYHPCELFDEDRENPNPLEDRLWIEPPQELPPFFSCGLLD